MLFLVPVFWPQGDTVTDKDDWNGKRSIIPVIQLAQTGASSAVLGLSALALAVAGLGFARVKARKSGYSAGKHAK